MANRPSIAFLVALLVLLASAGPGIAAVEWIENPAAPGTAVSASFPLVANGVAASIIIPADAPEVVKIAANDLASDIAAVSGVTPRVIDSGAAADIKGPRVELRISPDLAGRWEAFSLSASPDVLSISGSDRRGLAYGVYDISRRIGVSPWRWWADVPAPRHSELRLSLGAEPINQPAVKYRGIFINDEDWGLEPWASQTFEPEVGNIGPKTYSRIFELLLRLRGNLVWPGMHPTTRAFHTVPGNAAAADRYSIVVGSSHAEPMLRNNQSEWKLPADRYNYLDNHDEVMAYWEGRVKERTSGESLFTIGMRGVTDSPIVGPKNQAERIATLEKIFAEQRALLAKYLGNGDATRVGQIFCPYKEVLEDYLAGLRVPEDVTLVWPDDNYGYVRRYATPAERYRTGGLGVYYHVSYSGMPQSWLWIDTLPPALVWSEMSRAYEQGARNMWIVNVGDIKNTERSAEFFLDLAWNADRTDLNAPARFIQQTAARDFGKQHAAKVTDILTRLQTINFARKTEHLQWHLSLTAYKPTDLNEAEIAERLKACNQLRDDSEALAAQLAPEARDAYFQLVGYPVAITAAANQRYFHAELARADVVRQRPADANLAAAADGEKRVIDLTAKYNNEISGGKWRNIVTVNGVSPKEWRRFQRDTATTRPSPSAETVAPAAPPDPGALPRPQGAKSGDFVERAGVISILAGHFASHSDLPSGAGWRSIPGLGRSGSAVTVLPSTTAISPSSAPALQYRIHVATAGRATARVRLVPSFPLITDAGLRFALSIDDAAPIPLAVTAGFDARRSDTQLTEWQRRVLDNATEISAELPMQLTPGWHTLKLIAIDAGVVVDKIVIDLGGLNSSYDGPAETRIP